MIIKLEPNEFILKSNTNEFILKPYNSSFVFKSDFLGQETISTTIGTFWDSVPLSILMINQGIDSKNKSRLTIKSADNNFTLKHGYI